MILYRLNNIQERVNLWKQLLPRVDIFYAMKVLDDEKIIRKCMSCKTGFDVASANEIKKVLDLGAKPEELVYGNIIKSID